jgi:uncharacterized small protein (DUF1192 family)
MANPRTSTIIIQHNKMYPHITIVADQFDHDTNEPLADHFLLRDVLSGMTYENAILKKDREEKCRAGISRRVINPQKGGQVAQFYATDGEPLKRAADADLVIVAFDLSQFLKQGVEVVDSHVKHSIQGVQYIAKKYQDSGVKFLIVGTNSEGVSPDIIEKIKKGFAEAFNQEVIIVNPKDGASIEVLLQECLKKVSVEQKFSPVNNDKERLVGTIAAILKGIIKWDHNLNDYIRNLEKCNNLLDPQDTFSDSRWGAIRDDARNALFRILENEKDTFGRLSIPTLTNQIAVLKTIREWPLFNKHRSASKASSSLPTSSVKLIDNKIDSLQKELVKLKKELDSKSSSSTIGSHGIWSSPSVTATPGSTSGSSAATPVTSLEVASTSNNPSTATPGLFPPIPDNPSPVQVAATSTVPKGSEAKAGDSGVELHPMGKKNK